MLLFSATLPDELKGVMAENMNKDFVEVDCINDGDAHTASNVQESHVVIPSMDRYVSSVVEIVRLAMQPKEDGKKPKIVVFFPTARSVAFYSELFSEGMGIPVIELHSKKSQGYRNRASEQFRAATSGVLFTSDVSARGVDYPGVSQVIQFGMADSREQYIHRLGRTGRAGADGKGWLVLGPFENHFLQELRGMDIPRNDELLDLLSNPIEAETNDMLTTATDRIRSSKNNQSSAKGAYQAFLGFYLGKMKLMRMNNKDDLVAVANAFSSEMGLPGVPSLTKQMVGKMGLKGVRGVNIQNDDGNFQPRSFGAGANKKGHVNGRRRPN
jgi:ATP-dependent RNA helicase MSS116